MPYKVVLVQKPVDPEVNWGLGIRYWDASYYRHACPQEMWKLDNRYYEPRNVSEDCLHLNIFAPNVSFILRAQNRTLLQQKSLNLLL
jgi:carboxylesterase type B